MILGADHLAYSAPTLEAALADLPGYTTRFVERELTNHPAKRPFLHVWSELHTIAMLDRPPGLALEVLCHGPTPAGVGTYGYQDGVVTAPAGDREASLHFWRGLGFRPGAGRLQLRSPVPAWSLELTLEGPARTGYLDDAGFSCLALLTRRLERTLELAVAAGGRDASVPFTVEVAGKPLTVALLRSPGGSPVELLEIGRT